MNIDWKKIKQKIILNRSIRFIAAPLYSTYYSLLYKEYKKSEDVDFLRALQNKYNGQRCFIIGNGPSLKPSDLDKLENEVSFAANRIYHIYNKTKWRPNFYTSTDMKSIPDEIHNIVNGGNYPKFLNYQCKGLGRNEKDNIHYIFLRGKLKINPYVPKEDYLNDDASQHLTKVGTVTVTMIELAVYMGFKTIYLLGVDNNYVKKVDKNGKSYNDPEVQSSYFEGMQDSHGNFGDDLGYQNVESMNHSYQLAKQFADEHGVNIYNATRGGKLEVFPRVDFDGLFPINQHK